MVTCWHCKAESPRAHYARIVENKTGLYGPWTGWRMAGRFLIAPSGQRITPERLRGMLWEEKARAVQILRSPASQRTVIPARELFGGQA